MRGLDPRIHLLSKGWIAGSTLAIARRDRSPGNDDHYE
jgi:hypothetical protein